MRNKISAISFGAVGAIIFALTLSAFFLLDVERIALNIAALAFLLLSELILFGGLMGLRLSGRSGTFLNSGVATALSLYFIATFASALMAGLYRDRVGTFILIELTIMAVAAVALIVIFAVATIAQRRYERDAAKVGSKEAKRGKF